MAQDVTGELLVVAGIAGQRNQDVASAPGSQAAAAEVEEEC